MAEIRHTFPFSKAMNMRFRVCFFKIEPDLIFVIAMVIISVLLILKFSNIILCFCLGPGLSKGFSQYMFQTYCIFFVLSERDSLHAHIQ